MDDASQEIASAVGSQWTNLYVKLRLDYRGRFKIDTANAEIESYESRCRQCALDTIASWRETMKGVGEREALRRLLSVLMQLRNMESLVEKLAASNGSLIISPLHLLLLQLLPLLLRRCGFG